MKKKILSFAAIMLTLFAGNITCFATDVTTIPTRSWSNFFEYFSESSVSVALIIAFAVIVSAAVIMHKPISKKLNNSTSDHMLNTFIAIFAIFGIVNIAMSLLSDSVTFNHLLHSENSNAAESYHFYDYLDTLRNAGSRNFDKSAENFSPLSLLIFYIVAQFMPSTYIHSTSMANYLQMAKHQTFVYCYLIILMLIIVLLYKTSKKLSGTNKFNLKEEIFFYLLVVSYPSLYCIKSGNIAGLSFVFAFFFITFRNNEKRYIRELALVSLAVSAAITPYTLIFALILFAKDKNSVYSISKTALYSAILFILPAIFTGFDNLGTYISNLFVIPASIDIENIAISDILMFIGINNRVLLYIISAIFVISAAACIVILPATWQKTTAALYVIINIVPSSSDVVLLFAFIPFMLLLTQKAQKAVNWLYFASFSLLTIPLPEWFWFERESFNSMFESIGIYSVHNANEILAPVAVQLIFVLLISQAISVLTKCKEQKAIPNE